MTTSSPLSTPRDRGRAPKAAAVDERTVLAIAGRLPRPGPHEVRQLDGGMCVRCSTRKANGSWRGLCDSCSEIVLDLEADAQRESEER